MQFRTILPIACACALSIIAAPASADRKAYQGGMCNSGFVFVNSEWKPIHNTKSISGISVDAATVVWCPLIRDQSTSSSQVNQAIVEATNNDGGSISCTFYSQQEDTAGGTFDFTPTVTLSGSGFLEFNFDVSNFDTTSQQEGSYATACNLGANDILHHVYVVEENAGD